MSRKQPKRRAGNVVSKAIAGIFILAVVCGVGLNAASADSSDDLARAGGFGFDETTQQATKATQLPVPDDEPAPDTYYEQSALAQPSTRTIDAGLKMIDEQQKAERKRLRAERKAERERLEAERQAEVERVAQENAAAIERVKSTKSMQGVVDVVAQAEESAADEVFEVAPSYEYDLPAVDWSVGQDAFVAEWTGRIDAYLAGSPLEGYGYAFAQAAWENGVDPRWSPAIANTESSKGSVCFMPYNAWGWGESSWGDWDSAIRAHVAGLAAGYGYCITPEAAAMYCPPNSAYWYAATIEQMGCI